MREMLQEEITCLLALGLATGSYGHLLPLEFVVRDRGYDYHNK